VHEYITRRTCTKPFHSPQIADYRRSAALLAVAKARAELATRGLVVTVTQAYYGLVVAQRKYATSQRAAAKLPDFWTSARKLENGGEVAHADVLKARIQSQQQERDLQEALLDMERTRLDLAVMLFPDFNQDFAVVDDLQTPEPLPGLPKWKRWQEEQSRTAAALAIYQASQHEVTAAWGGLLPSLSLDYFYGIDSAKFAIRLRGCAISDTRRWPACRFQFSAGVQIAAIEAGGVAP